MLWSSGNVQGRALVQGYLQGLERKPIPPRRRGEKRLDISPQKAVSSILFPLNRESHSLAHRHARPTKSVRFDSTTLQHLGPKEAWWQRHGIRVKNGSTFWLFLDPFGYWIFAASITLLSGTLRPQTQRQLRALVQARLPSPGRNLIPPLHPGEKQRDIYFSPVLFLVA